MNAVNFIDGLDGLVAGVCLIANGVFFAYSYMLVARLHGEQLLQPRPFIAAVLIGACLGFLPLNWSPAKLFMGDSGALMLGLLMACSAIAITGQLEPSVLDPEDFGRSQLLGAFIPILLPVIVVLLPLLDFGLAVLRRMRAGKSPFSPDRKHLHHRMLDMGHTRPRRGADLLRVDGDRRPRGPADVHRHASELAGGLPPRHRLRRRRRRRVPGRDPSALAPAGAPTHLGDRDMSPTPVSSTPILRTTLIWSGIVTGILAVSPASSATWRRDVGPVERARRRARRRAVPRHHGDQHPHREPLVRRRPVCARLLRHRPRRLDSQVRRVRRRCC